MFMPSAWSDNVLHLLAIRSLKGSLVVRCQIEPNDSLRSDQVLLLMRRGL